MGEAVAFTWTVAGQADLLASMQRVSDRAKKTATEVAVAARQQVDAEKAAAKAIINAAKAAAKEKSAAVKAAAKEEAAAVKAASKAATDASKASAKASADASKAAAKSAAAASKAIEAEARKQVASEKKAADAKIRETDRGLKHVANIRTRHFATMQRQEEQAAKKAAGAVTSARKQAQAESNDRWGSAGKAVLGGIVGVAATGAALSTAAVGAAARDSLQLQETSNRLSINSRAAGTAFVDPTTLRKEFEQTAIDNPGQRSQDIAEAVGSFVSKTGNLDAGRRFSGSFASIASASGADVKDIGTAAADLFEKFKITDINDMRDALAALTFQGKAGSFELKDAAAQFGKMSAAASRFGFDKGAGGVKTLGGLTQIARSATGSSEQAATAVEATLRQLISEAPKLAASGVKVFDKTGKTRNVEQILPELIAKIGGSNMAAKKIGLQKRLGEEGIRAVSPLISTYESAYREASGSEKEKTAAATKAVREQLEAAIRPAGSWTEAMKDKAQAESTSSAQLTAAWEGLKAKVGNDITPALIGMVPNLLKLTESMLPLVGAMAEGVGALADFSAFLRELSGKGPKEKTHADKAKSAQEELVKLDKKIAESGAPTMADAARREALTSQIQVETALGGVESINTGAGKGIKGQRNSDAMRKAGNFGENIANTTIPGLHTALTMLDSVAGTSFGKMPGAVGRMVGAAAGRIGMGLWDSGGGQATGLGQAPQFHDAGKSPNAQQTMPDMSEFTSQVQAAADDQKVAAVAARELASAMKDAAAGARNLPLSNKPE